MARLMSVTPTPTQVRDAVSEVERDAWGPTTAASLIAAARQWLDERPPCEKCGGEGEWDAYRQGRGGEDICPACAGRGYILNPERIEAAAKAYEGAAFGTPVDEDTWAFLVEHHPSEVVEMKVCVEAAILAYLGEPRP